MFSRFLTVFILLIISLGVFAATPIVTSDTHPEGEWSTARYIKIQIEYNDAEKFSYLVDKFPETVPELSGDGVIDATDSAINIGSKLDGVWWLHVRAKNSSGWSDTAHFEMKVDSNGPLRPENITATELPNGDIRVDWEAATDDLSGIAHYNVYRSNLRFVKDGGISREFRVRDAVAKKVGEEITELTFLDESVSEGYRYHYKIQSIDNAGNLGRTSSIASARAPSFCDFDPVLKVELVDENISIKIDTTAKFKKGHIVVISPSGEETVLIESESNVFSIDTSYSLKNQSDGDYNVSFSSIDDDFDPCYKEYIFVYDTINPVIKIISPLSTQVMKDMIKFELEVADGGENASGIENVSLFIVKDGEETLVGEAEKSGANYVFDWNTINYDNGRFKIIARVSDNGGNEAEVSGTYNFENTFFARIATKKAIEKADSEREKTVAFLADLEEQGIDTRILNLSFSNADTNLNYAKELFEKSLYFDLAADQAEKAKTIYLSINNSITVTNYGSEVYVYNLNQLDIFLSASGLDSSIVNESKQLIEKTQVSRKLTVKKIEKGNNVHYKANVVLSFINSGAEPLDIRVLEIIPKNFIDDANNIISKNGFEIIQNDPIIAFDSLIIESGKSKDIIYVWDKELTKEQADILLSSNLMRFYISPPMPIFASTDLSNVRLSSLLNFNSMLSSFPPVEFTTTNLVIIGVAVLVLFFLLLLILLLAVFGIYFFFIKKKR